MLYTSILLFSQGLEVCQMNLIITIDVVVTLVQGLV